MIKRWTLAIVLLSITQVIAAQTFDSLEFNVDKLTSQFNSNTPGCLIAIVKDGKQIFKKA